jgi:translation initiation factor 1
LKKTIAPAAIGPARVRYEAQGRKGKGVTVVSGLPLNEEKLIALSKELKRKLGVGGTVKDFVIELQGDRGEDVAQLLRVKGYL